MEIQQILSYENTGLSVLLEQYKNSPKMLGVLQAFALEMQELETAMFEVKVLLAIQTAEGAQLDIIGRIANKPREGRDDAAYRAILQVWFRTRSSGRPEDIIRTIKETTGAVRVEYYPEYPAGFLLYAPTAGNYAQEILDFITAAGVGGHIACYLSDSSGDLIVDANGEPIFVLGPCDAYPDDNAWDGGSGAIDPTLATFTQAWPFRDSDGILEYPDGGFGEIVPQNYTFTDGSFADDIGGL